MNIEFTVNPESLLEFAEVLSENDMENQITGTTQDGNLLVDVHYIKADRDVIDQLEELAEAETDDEE